MPSRGTLWGDNHVGLLGSVLISSKALTIPGFQAVFGILILLVKILEQAVDFDVIIREQMGLDLDVIKFQKDTKPN